MLDQTKNVSFTLRMFLFIEALLLFCLIVITLTLIVAIEMSLF